MHKCPIAIDFQCKEYDSEKVVCDLKKDKIHFLNKTASFIWELLDGTNNLDDIWEAVLGKFDIKESTDLRKEISETIELFEKQGMLANN